MIVLYRRITSSEHALHLRHALSVLCNFNYRNALEAYNELKRTTTSKTQRQTTAHVALIVCQCSAMLNSSGLMRHRRWMCSTGSQLYARIVSSSLNCTVETSYGDKCPTLPCVNMWHNCVHVEDTTQVSTQKELIDTERRNVVHIFILAVESSQALWLLLFFSFVERWQRQNLVC